MELFLPEFLFIYERMMRYSFILEGSCSRAAVKHSPRDREVVGSNPAECREYFSSLSYQLFILDHVHHRGAILWIFLQRNMLNPET